MIKIIVFALIMTMLSNFSEGAVAIYPREEKPPQFACQRGCYLRTLNRVIGYNQTFYNIGNECASYTCHTDDTTTQFTCGVISCGSGTIIEGDLSLPYPDCCDRC